MEIKPLIPLLFCESCGWKRFIKSQEDLIDLISFPMSSLQKKTEVVERKSGFKCKKCGKLIIMKNIVDAQQELNSKLEKEKIIKEKIENEKNWFN